MKEVAYFLVTGEFKDTFTESVWPELETRVLQWIYDNLGFECEPKEPTFDVSRGIWRYGFETDEEFSGAPIPLNILTTKHARGDSWIYKHAIHRAKPITSSLLNQTRRDYGPYRKHL